MPTGDPRAFETYEELYAAFLAQLRFIVDQKIRVSNYIDAMFAKYAPAPFLSVVIDDCIAKGRTTTMAGRATTPTTSSAAAWAR